MQNSCKRCNEKERKKLKTCYWCGAEYSEDGVETDSGKVFDFLNKVAVDPE